MKLPTINYARTRDGRLELGVCPAQHRCEASDPERTEQGREIDGRWGYYALLRQPHHGGK